MQCPGTLESGEKGSSSLSKPSALSVHEPLAHPGRRNSTNAGGFDVLTFPTPHFRGRGGTCLQYWEL